LKLFQIEEPDGAPADPGMPGAAIGIDASGPIAEVAIAVGGNAVILADREGFERDLPVPAEAAAAELWQGLFEGARQRAERALARPVTHAVIVLAAPAEPAVLQRVTGGAAAAGLGVLEVVAPQAVATGEPASCAAAIIAEELMPRPELPLPGEA
jgi:hypothetical protein